MSSNVVVAQLGSRQDYTVPIALQNSGLLKQFYTDSYFGGLEVRLLQALSINKRFGRLAQSALSRHNPALDRSRVTRFNKLGLSYRRTLQQKTIGLDVQYRSFIDYGKKFNQAILRKGLPDSTHLYAFDHAALDLFRSAAAKGRSKVLDQIYPALYEESLEEEEEQRWPGWARSPRGRFYQSDVFHEWKEIQLAEWETADTIIVASRYSQDAIGTITPAVKHKLKRVPLTVDLSSYRPYQHVRQFNASRPLRVLFAGTVNLRKGLPYLLTAFQEVDPSIARLTVVGGIQLSELKIRAYQHRVDFRGPVPHIQMPQVYRDADVLVFPTISDGFGAVMLEAMATGLPVISTNHCADIVEEGINGFQVPIRSPQAIADAIVRIASDPDLLEHLSSGAIATSQRFTLDKYQARLCDALGL